MTFELVLMFIAIVLVIINELNPPKMEPCPPHIWSTNLLTGTLVCLKCTNGSG